MQAWILPHPQPIGQHPLQLAEVPEPTPGAGEVLVRVHVCGICRTDLHVVEGELPVRRPNITPGHQVVGEIAVLGSGVSNLRTGQRVGVAWLHHTDGTCPFCRSGRENLCEHAEFTGWTVPGGYAEALLASADFVYPIPDALDDMQAAPLLCAGIIGYRCLRLSGIAADAWPGARLGIYGFGAAGHIAIQIARARGAEVYVCTRDHERHQKLARELGAVWVGDAAAAPPAPLDAALMFAPAGELVPPALRALAPGATLVLGGIHMSPIPALNYDWLYRERVIRSVANNTRADGRDFLAEAHRAGVTSRTRTFPFAQANEALAALKNDAIAGAGVLLAP
ncbi:MAG: zinc-binding alcohol dehydrogenase family protein [Acidobacteria bacterium]|nr:MAG: zinc-binding alcohol dehydrogenase family protein [Acidobacteriota bacterium]